MNEYQQLVMSTAAQHHHPGGNDFVIPQSSSGTDESGIFQATGLINGLTPPADTSFFKIDDFTVFNNRSLSVGNNNEARVTWKIRTYIYATGTDPRNADDYAKLGGETFLIIVHSGSEYHSPTHRFGDMVCAVELDDSNLSFVTQLPANDSGVQDGKNHNYTIDFSQNLPMLKNQGEESFTFNAHYVEPFPRIGSEQRTGTDDNSHYFSIHTGDLSAMRPTNDIHGFTVLSTKKGGDWKPKIKFTYSLYKTLIAGGDLMDSCTTDYSPDLHFEY